MRRTVTSLCLFLLLITPATADDAPAVIRSAGATAAGRSRRPGRAGKSRRRGAGPGPRRARSPTTSRPTAIRSIHVAGTLRFDPDRDTRLDVGLIKIQAGDDASENGFDCEAHAPSADARTRPGRRWRSARRTARSPAGHTAVIRLAAVAGLDPETCPAIVCCGGRMDFHGAPLSRTWVKLGRDRRAGRAPSSRSPSRSRAGGSATA